MTEKCINSFMEQANSGDILLYPDVHGIKSSEDIGILEKGEKQDDGDWRTEYRLYDEDDGIGPIKAERINDIWKQMCGLPPYRKARQKGFSIEGYIPEGAIISADIDGNGNMRHRIINNILLDGVVLVPRQAYKSGIANAVFKALGEVPPWKETIIKKDLQGELQKIMSEDDSCNEYFRRRWDIMDALDKSIEKIMTGGYREPDKQKQLDIIFDEYKSIMIPLIIQSEAVFQGEPLPEVDENSPYGAQGNILSSKSDVLKYILAEMEQLSKKIGGK
jgi:hypothetical protein